MNSENLNLYYIFYITAMNNNISNAAKKLYITQPAVSKAISKLESNLEVTLFTRSSRGVKLTQTGEILFEQLKDAFHSIEKGEDNLKKSLQFGIGKLSIGVSTTLCKYVLLPTLPQFIKENPYVKLSISCQSTNNTLAALEREELDIGLVGEPKNCGMWHFYPIREIQDVFVTTKQYLNQLSIQNNSSQITLSDVTLLLLDKDNITRQYVEKYLIDYNLTPSSILEVSTMDLLIEFAKAGLGVACVIGDFIENELADGSLIPFSLKKSIPKRKIGFACKNSTNPTSFVEKFMQLYIPNSGDSK